MFAVLFAAGSACAPSGSGSSDGGLVDMALPQGSCRAWPMEVAATQMVTFHLKNTTAGDWLVATAGMWCSAFMIEQKKGADYVQLPLHAPFQCGCECPAPGPAYVTFYQIVPAGGSVDVTWDARARVECTEVMSCGGASNGPYAIGIEGALQPVTPGEYRFTVDVTDTPPMICMNTGGGSYRCHSEDHLTAPQSGSEQLCSDFGAAPAKYTHATAAFTLPASGNLSVDVPMI